MYSSAPLLLTILARFSLSLRRWDALRQAQLRPPSHSTGHIEDTRSVEETGRRLLHSSSRRSAAAHPRTGDTHTGRETYVINDGLQ